MVVQLAGRQLKRACDLRKRNVNKFLDYSGNYTLSSGELWYVTGMENGPVVSVVNFGAGDNSSSKFVVAVEGGGSPSAAPVSVKQLTARQENNSGSSTTDNETTVLFTGSALLYLTAFMTAPSVDLTVGAYRTHVNTQGLVRAMAAAEDTAQERGGLGDIEWAYVIGMPQVRDRRTQEESASGSTAGSTPKVVAVAAVGALMVMGMAAFMLGEGGMSALTGGAGTATRAARPQPLLPV